MGLDELTLGVRVGHDAVGIAVEPKLDTLTPSDDLCGIALTDDEPELPTETPHGTGHHAWRVEIGHHDIRFGTYQCLSDLQEALPLASITFYHYAWHTILLQQTAIKHIGVIGIDRHVDASLLQHASKTNDLPLGSTSP